MPSVDEKKKHTQCSNQFFFFLVTKEKYRILKVFKISKSTVLPLFSSSLIFYLINVITLWFELMVFQYCCHIDYWKNVMLETTTHIKLLGLFRYWHTYAFTNFFFLFLSRTTIFVCTYFNITNLSYKLLYANWRNTLVYWNAPNNF